MDDQDLRLERLQASALWCIYGFDVPYSLMRVRAEVTTLRLRQIEAADKFAKKYLSSNRFEKWFPGRSVQRRGRRT